MMVQCSVGHPVHQSPLETLAPWHCHNQVSLGRDDDTTLFDVPSSSSRSITQGPNTCPKTRVQVMRDTTSLTSSTRNDSVCKTKSVPHESTTTSPTSPPSPPRQTSSPSPSPPSAASVSASCPQQAANVFRPLNRSEKPESSPLPSPAPTPPPAPIAAHSSQKISQKRRRPLSDVDGVDTADLSVKKRRLRLQLITSRLSKPFSLPATHILNREAIAGLPGDGKRFVKLAAYLSARRAAVSAAQTTGVSHNPSSVDLLRRTAVLNRVRIGMSHATSAANQIYAYAYSHQRCGTNPGVSTVAAIVYHGMQLVNAARYFFPSPLTPAPPPQHQNMGPVAMSQWHHHHTPNHVHVAPGPTPMSQHYGALLPKIPPPVETPCQTPPMGTQKVEYHHAKLPPSPKLKPTLGRGSGRLGPSPLACSPDLRPARERDFDENDEVDDDSIAFPGSELDNRYADESDDSDGDSDGYDFSAIFGGTSNAGLTSDDLDELEFGMLDDQLDDRNEHFYEEYLDELDGIPRGTSGV